MSQMAKTVFSRHGQMWARQSIRSQQEFAARARQHRTQRSHEIAQDMANLTSQLEIVLMREAATDFVPPVCMSASSLTDVYLTIFHNLMQQDAFRSPSRLRLARADLLVAPPPESNPPLPAGAVMWARRESPQPSWTADIIKYRDFFEGAALVLGHGTPEPSYFKIVYAVQKPWAYLAVCRLEPVPFEIEHLADSSPSFLQMHLNYVKYKFKCNFAAMMSAEDMPQATTESVSVLFNLKHDGGVYLSSQWELVPLKIFLRGKEVTLVPEPKAEAEEKDVLFDEMVVAMPWLQHLDKVHGVPGEHRDSRGNSK